MTTEVANSVTELRHGPNQELSDNLLLPSTASSQKGQLVTDQPSIGSCELCEFASITLTNLTEHYNEVHSLQYCVICNMNCSSKFHLDTHLKAAHPDLFSSGKLIPSDSIKELRAKMGYTFTPDCKPCYTCNYCDKKVAKRTHIITHVRIHTGEQPFKCAECDFKSAYRQTIQKHRDTVHLKLPPKRPYSCSQCEKTFLQKSHLLLHEPVHDQSKLFSCDKCNYSSTKEVNLREHVLDKHSNFSEEILKPHVCEVCGFRFKSSCHLIRHLKVHNRDVMKPYLFKCEYCNSSFTERYNLRVHIEIKHEQKPFRYICSECNKGFHGKKDLELHSITHQIDPVIHQCSECDFKSKHVKSVKRHYKKKHCDDSPPKTKRFECDVCNKNFENAAKLKRHHYVHKDKSLRPTACSECSYRCIEKSQLKRHMELLHGSPGAPKASSRKKSVSASKESATAP